MGDARGQPLVLFAWPDETAERNDYELAIPKLGSLILTHEWEGWSPGSNRCRRGAPAGAGRVLRVPGDGRDRAGSARDRAGRPLLRWRGRLYDTRWFSCVCAFSSPLPFHRDPRGWTVTETGRQPYVVYGLLRTADAVSPVAAGAVFGSLALFVALYSVLLLAFFYYATRLVLRGPEVARAGAYPPAMRPGVESAVARGGPDMSGLTDGLDLPLLLGLAVAFGVVMYVVMDGFDLGIGILFPFAPGDPERSTMINSIAPVWDGNETWLVLGGSC